MCGGEWPSGEVCRLSDDSGVVLGGPGGRHAPVRPSQRHPEAFLDHQKKCRNTMMPFRITEMMLSTRAAFLSPREERESLLVR